MVKRFGAGQVGIQQASSRFRSGAVIRKPVAQQLTFQPEDTSKQQKELLIQSSLTAIEDKINWFKQQTERKRQEVVKLGNEGRDTSRASEQYDQQKFIGDVNIDKLIKARSLAQQGTYTTTSLLSYASAQAGSRLDRAEMTQILREKEIEKTKQEPILKETMETFDTPPKTLSVKSSPVTIAPSTLPTTQVGTEYLTLPGQIEPSQKGMIFFKKEEAEERGIKLTEGEGEGFYGQQFILQAEDLMGKEKGSSGVVAVSSIDPILNLKRESLLATKYREHPILDSKSVNFLEKEGQVSFPKLSFPGKVRQGIYKPAKKIGEGIFGKGEYQVGIPVFVLPGAKIPLFKINPSRMVGEVALFSAFAPAMQSTLTMSKGIEQQAQRITMEQLSKKPFKTQSIGVGTKDASAITIKATRKGYGFQQEVNIYGKLIKTQQKNLFGLKGQGYVLPTGKMDVVTAGKFEYVKIGGKGIIKQPSVINLQTFTVGAKSLTGQGGKVSTALTKFVQIQNIKKPKTDIGYGFGIAKAQVKKVPLETSKDLTIFSKPFSYYKATGYKITDLGKVGTERWMDIKLSSYGVGKQFYAKLPKATKDIGFKGGGKKMSDTFLKQLYTKQETGVKQAVVQSYIPSIKITPTLKITKMPVTTSQALVPAISKYTGTGLYERTESYGVASPKQIGGGLKLYEPLQGGIKIFPILSQPTKLGTFTIEKIKGGSKFRTDQPAASREELDTGQLLKTPQKQKTETKQDTRLIQKYKLQPLLGTKQITTESFWGFRFPVPKIRGSKKPFLTLKLDEGGKGKTKGGQFEVGLYRYIRGKRKRLSLGTGSLSGVFKLGQFKTKGTLARTFQVRQASGLPIKTLPLPPGFRFGKSKKTKLPSTFVQLAKYSLGTVGEKTEIQRARRKKK